MRKEERFHDLTTGDAQLDRLKVYLSDYHDWERRLKDDNGLPNSASWSAYIKDVEIFFAKAEATDVQTVNLEAMRIIDRSLSELAESVPELSIAIRWRYMNLNVEALVFRFKRLAGRSIEQLDDLADAGEKALLPIAKRRGLYL